MRVQKCAAKMGYFFLLKALPLSIDAQMLLTNLYTSNQLDTLIHRYTHTHTLTVTQTPMGSFYISVVAEGASAQETYTEKLT